MGTRPKCLHGGWSHKSEKPKHNVNPKPREKEIVQVTRSLANLAPILDQSPINLPTPEESANPSPIHQYRTYLPFFDQSLNLWNVPQYRATMPNQRQSAVRPNQVTRPIMVNFLLVSPFHQLCTLFTTLGWHRSATDWHISCKANLITLLLIHHRSANQPTINPLENKLTNCRTPPATWTTHRRALDIPLCISQSSKLEWHQLAVNWHRSCQSVTNPISILHQSENSCVSERGTSALWGPERSVITEDGLTNKDNSNADTTSIHRSMTADWWGGQILQQQYFTSPLPRLPNLDLSKSPMPVFDLFVNIHRSANLWPIHHEMPPMHQHMTLTSLLSVQIHHPVAPVLPIRWFANRGTQNTMSILRQSKKVSANLVPILDQSLT